MVNQNKIFSFEIKRQAKTSSQEMSKGQYFFGISIPLAYRQRERMRRLAWTSAVHICHTGFSPCLSSVE